MAKATLVVPRVETSEPQLALARFTHGKLTSEKDLKFGLLESLDKPGANKRKERKLVAETAGMQYVGAKSDRKEPTSACQLSLKNSLDESFQYKYLRCEDINKRCKYLVGVYDKKTNKVQVCHTDVFNLNPYWPDEEDGEDEVDRPDLTYAEKVDQLTSAFGSTKRKKAMESRRKNKIKGEVLEKAVGSAVDHALSHPQMAMETSSPTAAPASVIPPHDVNATTPQEAYRLADIVTSEELDVMQNPAQEFVDCTSDKLTEWRENAVYPSYVLHQVQVLPVQGEARTHKACLLMYMTYLIQLYNLKAPDFKRKNPLPEDIPSAVLNALYEKYTLKAAGGAGGKKPLRCMSARLKDKLVSYILVLALIIDEFNLEFSQLQEDLKMGQRKMQTHLRSLGCKVATKKVALNPLGPKVEVRTASLPMPLTFPDLNRARKMKGR